MAETGALRVTVVYANRSGTVHECALVLGVGATVAQALETSRLLQTEPELQHGIPDVGVWGKRVGMEAGLLDQDRVEIYRPLVVDPKVARRERFRKQGRRTAGLFATKP